MYITLINFTRLNKILKLIKKFRNYFYKKMKVKIIKGSKIFQVHSSYNQKVLRLIKTIKNRYYCRKKKTWYLPIEDFDIFIESLTNITEIEINSSDIN